MESVQVEGVEAFSTPDADEPRGVVLREDVQWNAVKVFSAALRVDDDIAIGDVVTRWLASSDGVLVEVVIAHSSNCLSIVLFYWHGRRVGR